MIVTFYNPLNMCFGGGGERWLFEISRRLSQKGYEVNIISLKYPPNTNRPNFRANNDFHYFELPYVKLPRGNPIPSPSSIRDILKKFNDSDVVYFYVSPPNEIILKIFKSGLRSPIIGGFHSFMWHRITLQRLYSYFMKYSLKVFNAFHVLNSYLFDLLQTWDYNNIYFIPNGVDTSIFKPITFHEGSTSERFEVLFVSRFVKEKGIDVLINVIKWINEKYTNIKNKIMFKIAGKGTLKTMIERLTSKYNNVIYLGFLDANALVREYSRSHTLVITSYIENMPLTLLEASACGLPAIASAVPGILDVVKTLGYGALVKVGSYKDFARAILRFYQFFIRNPDAYLRIRRIIRERTVRNYDWGLIVNKFEKMLKDLNAH